MCERNFIPLFYLDFMRSKGVPPQLKAVLFDFDGTLIDSRKDIAASANATRRHYAMPSLPEETIGAYIGNGVQVLLEKIMETKDPERLKEALRFYKDYYRDHCADHTSVYPGTIELLEALQNRKIKMAVVSNKPQEFTVLILEKLGLARFFAVALGPESTVNRKPHPEPLLTVLRRMAINPSGAVMIGDSAVDVEAARAAGIPVGIVTQGYGDHEALMAAKPDWLVDSLSEFMDIFF